MQFAKLETKLEFVWPKTNSRSIRAKNTLQQQIQLNPARKTKTAADAGVIREKRRGLAPNNVHAFTLFSHQSVAAGIRSLFPAGSRQR
jgi:hypothetical protein